MNARIDVWSATVCDTYCGRENGDTAMNGANSAIRREISDGRPVGTAGERRGAADVTKNLRRGPVISSAA
jgi:hypothetical protein